MDVIRIWAGVAWADGVIAEAERTAIERLIKTAKLSDDERATALGWLEAPVSFENEHLTGLSHESRLGVYRAAARLAAVDQDVAAAEKVFLDRLRVSLGVTEDEAHAIEADIPGHR